MSARITARHDECGWTGGPYRSRAQADYALTRHSCERARRAAEQAERGRAREAAVDRTPQPCLHIRAKHEHGTYRAYVLDRCRCVPCARANSQYELNRTRQQAYGRWKPFVDARPATEHLRALSAAGMGWRRAALAAGVPPASVYPLLYGRPDRNGGKPRTKARRELVDAILAVPRRRLEALIALGWTVARLAKEHHLDRQALDSALTHVPVQARTAVAVRDMYAAIGDRRPGARSPGEQRGITLALRRATDRGWVVPAMWDDADLDDPYAEPPAPQDSRTGLDLDEWLHLVRGGEDPDRAAQRCGYTLGGVTRVARRDSRDDILRLLQGAAA